MGLKMLKNKTIYVTPKIQVLSLCSYNILTASGVSKEIEEFNCPYVPETKCELFCDWAKRRYADNKDMLKGIENGTSFAPCPYKNGCEEYRLYKTFKENEKQR